MDINRFTGVLAARLEAEGADRESAIRHSRAFIGSLPESEAAKIADLCERSDDAMNRIVSSLKKRAVGSRADGARPSQQQIPQAQMQPQQPPQPQPRQTAQPRPVQIQNEQQNAARPRRTRPTPEQNQPAEMQQPAQQTQVMRRPQTAPAQSAQNAQPNGGTRQAQPIGQVRRLPAHLIDHYDDDDNTDAMLSPRQRVRPAPQRAEQPRRQAQPQTPQTQSAPRHTQSSTSTSSRSRAQAQNTEKRVIYKPDPNADYQRFYIIFWCTCPIWGFLALCILGLFAFALLGMLAAIVGLIGALFIGVAAGTVLALVGIIYGITQLFEYAPIGMYEIGLGVMIGGWVMFGGIVVYNTAVRLLPYLIRKELDLFTYTVHKCVELYYRVKGACADL